MGRESMEMKKAPISVSASNPMMTPTNSVARTEEASTPRGVVGEVLSSSNALPAAEGSSAVSDAAATSKAILLDDPKSLHNTEEEVKDVLLNLASFSPSRNAPILSHGASRSLPRFSQSPAGTPEVAPSQTTNIVLEYKFGKPETSV